MQIRDLRWPALVLLAAATAAAGVGTAASRLAHAGPGRAVVETAVAAPDVPAGDAPRARATGTLTSRPVPAPPAGDRGSRFTDAADGLASAPLTGAESAKLALARDAIVAAEAAGTRTIHPVEVHDAVFSAEELEAIKRQQAAARIEALLTPASGPLPGEGRVPAHTSPTGTNGSDVLAGAELEKLRKEGLR